MRLPTAFVSLLLVLHLPLSGCATYQPVPRTEPDHHTISGETLRLTLRDGSQLQLHEARAEADSLVGYSGPLPRVSRHSPTYEEPTRLAVALADVQTIEVRKRRYTGLILAGAALAFFVAFVLLSGEGESQITPAELSR